MVSYTRSIPAGGKGKVTIKLNTKGYGGRTLSKVARIYTNDPDSQVVHLRVSGPVESFVTISPSVVRLVGAENEILEERVRIVPDSEQPFKITGARADKGRDIDFRLEPARFGEKEGYWLIITGTRQEPGSFYDYIYLETDEERVPELKVRVHGNIFKSRPDDDRPDKAPEKRGDGGEGE